MSELAKRSKGRMLEIDLITQSVRRRSGVLVKHFGFSRTAMARQRFVNHHTRQLLL